MVARLRQRLEQEKGRLGQVRADLSQSTTRLTSIRALGLIIEQAQVIIQTVGLGTQNQLQYCISNLVSSCIESIFPDDDYKFFLEFVQRRGRTEADLFLADSKGNRIKPSDAEGGGLINVVAFALRVALWSLIKSSRPVLILDEPFSFLHSRDAHAKVAELLKTISERLGLQIIMVTGEDESEEIIEGADKIFKIKKIKGVSTII